MKKDQWTPKTYAEAQQAFSELLDAAENRTVTPELNERGKAAQKYMKKYRDIEDMQTVHQRKLDQE